MLKKIIWTVLVVAYMLSPYDLLPDFLLGWGWLDDMVALALLVRYYSVLKKRAAGQNAQFFGQQGRARFYKQNAEKKDSRPAYGSPQDPHTVLGVRPNAGQDEIRAAFRKLALQYHPDKVAFLGDEFKALAEKRFTEIQAAYDQLRHSKK